MRNIIKLIIISLIYIAITSLMISCTTSKGKIYSKIVTEESKKAKAEKITQKPSETQTSEKTEEKKGIKIITHPDEAEVYINNMYQGKSPILIENIDPGSYRITISRKGYYTKTVLLDYSGNLLIYETELKQIVGFLNISTTPHGTMIKVDDFEISEGMHQLPIGHYTVTVRKFGYEDYKKEIEINELDTVNLNVVLKRAEFDISNLETSKTSFSPMNPGLLGQITVRFHVTSWGTGAAKILDSNGKLVYKIDFPQFSTWEHTFNWNGKNGKGKFLPEGIYIIKIEGKPLKGGQAKYIEKEIKIDNSLKITYRNVWNGTSGLLYATSPETLPPESIQFSVITQGHIEQIDNNLVSRFPTSLSLRTGLNGKLEIDVLADMIAGNTGIIPLGGSISLKKNILRTTGFPSISYGGYLKGAYIWGTSTDIFTNYSAISIGFPIELAMGIFKLFYSIELAASPYRIIYPDTPHDTSLGDSSFIYAWLYNRMGMMVDLGYLTTALSISLRTSPVTEFNWIEYPVQAGFEISWLVPDTHLFLSFVTGSEINSIEDYYIFSGIGLGVLY